MNRRGFILIAVLWIMVMLSAVVLDRSIWVRTRTAASTALTQANTTVTSANAGIEYALEFLEHELIAAQPVIQKQPDARFNVWRALPPLRSAGNSKAQFDVTFRDAGSAVNLNSAPETELRRFFTASGFDDVAARAAAMCLVDWRDADDVLSPGGCDKRDFIGMPRAVTPINAPFTDAAEFATLPGVDPVEAQRVLGDLTELGTGRININTASVPVLASVEGITVETARAIERARLQSGPLPSVFAVLSNISAASQAELTRDPTHLSERLTTEVLELEIRSTGFDIAGNAGASIVLMVVRRNTDVTVATRRIAR